jgi:hypothetical protein
MKDKNGKELYIGAHVTYANKDKECLGTVTGINVSNNTACVMSLSEDNDICYDLMLDSNELAIV